jgi:hypothetical protein
MVFSVVLELEMPQNNMNKKHQLYYKHTLQNRCHVMDNDTIGQKSPFSICDFRKNTYLTHSELYLSATLDFNEI